MDTKVHIARYLAITVFALLGVQGLVNSYYQWGQSDAMGRMIQTALLFGYGIAGATIAMLLTRKQRIHYMLQTLWALCIIASPAMAPIVWAGEPYFTGIFSAIGGSTIAAGSLWLVHLHHHHS